MKGLIFTFFMLLFALVSFSQATYYWIGGAGPVSYTANSSWNTQLDGGGTNRTAAAATDILVFDGTNIGGTVPATGLITATATTTNCGRLIFQNGAQVNLGRAAAGSAAITINGDGTAADDLVVGAGCTVTLGMAIYNYDVSVVVSAAATALISGTVYLSPLSPTVHTRSYITATAANSVVFATGAACHITDSSATSGFNGSAVDGITFRSGASLYYYSGRSPIGTNSTTQITKFDPGSNLYFRGPLVRYDGGAAYTSSSWINQKVLANIFVQNSVTLTADGPSYKIEDLTIDNGCTFITHTSGHTPVLGNLLVNGAFTFPGGSTNTLVMGGHVPQTLSGTGTITVPNFVVANFSDVTLSKIIMVTASCNVAGKVDFGSAGQITGAGTFTSRVTSTGTGNTGDITAGSYLITNFPAPGSIIGYEAIGAGLAPNTQVVGFGTTANTIYLSKPAVSTLTGTAFSFTSDTATLVTANVNGMDNTSGSVTVTDIRTFQSGTNYIINAATTHPFGISSSVGSNIILGSVVLNAPVTTNYNCRVVTALNLANGKLTIRPTDTVRILSGTAIEGAPFSSSKYIVTDVAGNNVGVLRIDNLPITTTLFPVGNASYYLPVTVTPASTVSHAVSVFQGVTEDGTPTGAAFTAAKKANVVDAVWIVNRPTGTGDCIMQLQWDAALEGTSFTGFTNANVGIGRHDGVTWGTSLGSGDNTANTATALYSNFSAFGVGYNSAILASLVKNISAYIKANAVEINWQVANETGIQYYEIEKSVNRTDFTKIGQVNASGKDKYIFTDVAMTADVVYYRIRIVGLAGDIKYTDMVAVRKNGAKLVSLYPNPAVSSINITGLTNATVYRIINATGQVVLQQRTTANSINIDVSGLQSGLYTVEILSTDNTAVQRSFIKQ